MYLRPKDLNAWRVGRLVTAVANRQTVKSELTQSDHVGHVTRLAGAGRTGVDDARLWQAILEFLDSKAGLGGFVGAAFAL